MLRVFSIASSRNSRSYSALEASPQPPSSGSQLVPSAHLAGLCCGAGLLVAPNLPVLALAVHRAVGDLAALPALLQLHAWVGLATGRACRQRHIKIHIRRCRLQAGMRLCVTAVLAQYKTTLYLGQALCSSSALFPSGLHGVSTPWHALHW